MSQERFEAFISYQRDSTGALAAALQPALERFAKPWYRLRASRVFRDDASMSANTALWSTIEDGLTQSEWLILLASPEAAASEYVANEVAWWLEHKSAERILLVQAKGDLVWDRAADRFDAARSTALPSALVDAYAEEPRWIDMRWFLEEGSQQTADPRFEERVVDLAASTRGIERDQLIGENVRQHKRVRRITRAAVTSLAVLLVASLGAGAIAIAQSAEASAQRDVARDESRIATARQLAATSQSLAASDVVLSRLLADQAFRMNDDALTRAALLQSVSGNPDFTAAVDVGSRITALAATDDGRVAAVGTESGDVHTWHADSGELTALGTLPSSVVGIAVDADGDVVAAAAGGEYSLDASSGTAWVLPRVAVWAGSERIDAPEGAGAPVVVSPDGGTVVFQNLTDPTSPRLGAVDVRTGTSRDLGAPPSYVHAMRMSDDASVVVELGAGLGTIEATRLSLDGLSTVESGFGGWFVLRFGNATLSSDAAWGAVAFPEGLITARRVFQTPRDAPDDLFGRYEGTNPTAFAVSPDGARVAIADTGVVRVVDLARDAESSTTTLLPGAGRVTALHVGDAGSVLSAADERLTLWRPGAQNPLLRTHSAFARWLSNASPAPGMHVAPSGAHAIVSEDDATSTWHQFEFAESVNRPATFLDWYDAESAYLLESGQLVRMGELFRLELSRVPTGLPAEARISAARYVAASGELLIATADRLFTIDAETGETLAEEEMQVEAISGSGRHLAVREDDEGRIVDRASGEVVSTFDAPLPTTLRYEGDALVISRQGTARVYSENGQTERVTIADHTHIPSAIDDGRDVVATYATDGTLQLASLVTGLRLGEIVFPHESSRRPGVGFSADGETLALVYEGADGSMSGTMHLVDLSPATWTRIACETAGRDITADEWRRFVGDDVPENRRCGG